MAFAYKEYDKRTFAEITKGLNIKTDTDYRVNMHFAAKPDFKVSLQHGTHNFFSLQINYILQLKFMIIFKKSLRYQNIFLGKI